MMVSEALVVSDVVVVSVVPVIVVVVRETVVIVSERLSPLWLLSSLSAPRISFISVSHADLSAGDLGPHDGRGLKEFLIFCSKK